MADAWDDAEETAKGAGIGGDFFKLESGQSASIAILGAPLPYTAHPYEGRANAKPSQKILLSVFNGTAKAQQIWDMAAATFNGLLEVTGKPSKPGKFPIDRWTYTVKRNGTGTKTRYTILPDKELTAQQKAFMQGLPLPDLGSLANKIEFTDDDTAAVDLNEASKAPSQRATPVAADDDIPF